MTDVVVRPVRFTDNLKQMQRFLETLGLRPRIESELGGWVDMVASGGMVALHSAVESERGAPSGFTSLGFEADDADVLAERLTAAGVSDVVVYDESYGRVLSCRDPLGDEIQVDERSDDLYGYRRHQTDGVVPGWRVMSVRFADPMGAYDNFLQALGLERRGEPNEHFTPYTAGGGEHGVVGLHHPGGAKPPFATEGGAVDLSFETSEPLVEVAQRLVDNGFEARIREEPFGSVLTTVDGDGQSLEVHEAPQSSA